MEIQFAGRFLGMTLDEVEFGGNKHDMIKMQVYSGSSVVDLYVVDTNDNYNEILGFSFGEEITVSAKLVERDGGGYKLKFVSLL